MSQEKAAFERFESARTAARTGQDTMDALWGLVLVSLELEPERAPALLNELETAFPQEIDVRFRLAVGRSVATEQGTSLVGVWEQFEALLPAIQHAEDPLAASCFLAIGSAMAVMSGRYVRGKELANEALRVCHDFRVEFGAATCFAHRAAAELGMRQLTKARRSVQLLAQSSLYREDPFFLLEALRLRARLLAYEGAFEEAIATETEVPVDCCPPRPFGVYLSNLALILASVGHTKRSRQVAHRARRYGSNIEMHYCAQLAEAIAEGSDGSDRSFKRLATKAVRDCGRAKYMDGLVFAYRLWPDIVAVARDDPEARGVMRKALALGRDHRLAANAGVELRAEEMPEPLAVLTGREREVLALLLRGMTNAEIATRLFISPSTTKVHVRHILEKLGVRSRLQAVIRAQELMNSENG
jgi:DNA-binding CsgD family transcriptional regulator